MIEKFLITLAITPTVLAIFNLAFAAVGLSPGSVGIGQLEDLIGALIWMCGFAAAGAFHWFITGGLLANLKRRIEKWL